MVLDATLLALFLSNVTCLLLVTSRFTQQTVFELPPRPPLVTEQVYLEAPNKI
jgi:hypothetical protein